MRRLSAAALSAALVAPALAALAPTAAAAAQTAAATPIVNTATATYTDNNAQQYGIASNAVVAVVQNAPVVTINNPAGQTVTPNEIVVDTFSVSNAGNGTGTFAVPADASVGSNGTLKGYVLANFTYATGATPCTVAAPCSLQTLNADLAAVPVAAGGSVPTIGVEYQVGATISSATIPVSLGVTIAYAAQSQTVNGTSYSAAAQTSAVATGTETDNLSTDARLDIAKSVTPPTSASAPIAYSIVANDGGKFGAHDLLSAQALVGASTAGILITDKLPTFGTPNTIALASTPSVTLAGASSGAHAVVYYTSDATGGSGWTTTYNANAAVVGVYITGGANAIELPAAPNGSQGAGSVQTPQVTLNLAITQPTGAGSGNAGSVSNIANSVIGGNPGTGGTVPVLGPNVPPGTVDGGVTAQAAIVASIGNTTASTGTSQPGGASNVAVAAAYGASAVYLGPVGFPQATGSYPAAPNAGAAAADSFNDFTAVSVPCSNTSASLVVNNNYTAPTATNSTGCTLGSAVSVPVTLLNSGNVADTFTLSAVAPAGYTVALYAGNCTGAITVASAQVCTLGAQIGTTSTAGGTASGTYPAAGGNLIASGATVNAVAVYTASGSVPPFVGVDSTLTAVGSHDSGQTPERNTTHADIYPGGVIALNKTQTITASGCSGTPPAGGVCPGGTISYGVAYRDVAPATTSDGGAALGTEPTFAYAPLSATGLNVVEDGNQQVDGNANSWGTTTYGAQQPTDTNASTTFAAAAPFSSGGTNQGPYHFAAQVGGSTGYRLQPGNGGTITFAVTVK